MAGSGRAPTPQFFISDKDKEGLVEQVVPQIIYAMERMGTVPEAPLADDFLDIFARAAAVMLAADTNFKTPRDLRLGAETMAVHVLGHMIRYRAEAEQSGRPAFHRMLADYEMPEEIKRAWENS